MLLALLVDATDPVQPVLDQAQGIVAELQEEMFSDLDPTELATCLRVLGELARRLDRAEEA